MNKRIAVVIILAIIATLAAAGLPLSGGSRVAAQGPMFFGATRAPFITVDKDDNLYLFMSVATKDASAGTPGSQIFFAKSVDGGAHWNNFPHTRNLSKSKGEAFGPSGAINKEGTTRGYVVYHDNAKGTTQAYLIRAKKKDKFKGPVNITPHNEGAFAPRLAIGANESLNVTWGDTSGGNKKVVYLRSTDQGITFSEPLIISGSSTQAFEPEIAVIADRSSGPVARDIINVVWEDAASGRSVIMFSQSLDSGQTFSAPSQISKGSGSATEAHIAASSASLYHVVWVEQTDDGAHAFYARSTDAGQTFSDPIQVSDEPDAEIEKPFVVASDDTVYIAFHDDKRNNKQVFLVTSEDGGLSFDDPEQVSQANNARGRAHSPSIVLDSDNKLHIVYIDASLVGNDEGILFYRNTTNGRRFSTALMILAAI